MNRYATTIVVIHNAENSNDAMRDAEAYVATLREAIEAIEKGISETTEHVSRYNTRFVSVVE